MTARIECGDWGCSREGKQVYADVTIPETKDESERREAARRSIRCGVHAGAEKRRRWGVTPTFVPLAERADIRMLAQAHYDKAQQQRVKAAEVQRAEARKKGEARFLDAWDNYNSEEDTYVIENLPIDDYSVNRGVYNVSVHQPGMKGSWNASVIRTEDSSRYDDLPHPLNVRLSSGQTLSPKEARVFAKAISLMADRVEAANELLRLNDINLIIEQVRERVAGEKTDERSGE